MREALFLSEEIDVLRLFIVTTKIMSVSASTTLQIMGKDCNKLVILFAFQEAENHRITE